MPRILVRRATASAWSAANPILGDGEIAFEHDTGRVKIGDGASTWTALAYLGSSGGVVTAADISDASTVGRSVLTAADATTARATLGAGTSSLALGTTSTTALAGNTTPADIGAATTAQGAKADSAVQPAALTSLAPLASPAFTGAPTAPTATAGTNSTQLANTAFVAAAIAALINSAPGALDTLNELAAAIGDDANFATTVTNALALKANISALAAVATSGSASDLSAGQLALARLPDGASIHVVSADGGTTWTDLSGATISARPTSRTDVRVIFETSGSTLPAWAITGDLLFKIGT